MSYTLFGAKAGNSYSGYEGTVLGFLQNGNLLSVGSDYTQQVSSYGPINVQWVVGMTVQVLVLNVSATNDTSKQGF